MQRELNFVEALGNEASTIFIAKGGRKHRPGQVRVASSGPALPQEPKQVTTSTVFLKNTQDTDPSWVLLKCQEQAHVVREGTLMMQAMSLQEGAGLHP